jgi:hypothetical protein
MAFVLAGCDRGSRQSSDTSSPRLAATGVCEGPFPDAPNLVTLRLDVRLLPDTDEGDHPAIGVVWQPDEPPVMFDQAHSSLGDVAQTTKPGFAAARWVSDMKRQGAAGLAGPVEVSLTDRQGNLRFLRAPTSDRTPSTFRLRYFVSDGSSSEVEVRDPCAT